jgi:PAS domain-containing protein
MSGCSADAMKGSDLHWSAFYETRRATLADMIVDGIDDLSGIYQDVRPSKYAGGGWQAEGWYCFGGVMRYLLFEAAPIMDKNGNIVAAVETLEDITSRKKTEEALIESEARQKAAVENLVQMQKELEEKHAELKFLFNKVEQAKLEWEQTLDHISDIVIMADSNNKIRRYKHTACQNTLRLAQGFHWFFCQPARLPVQSGSYYGPGIRRQVDANDRFRHAQRFQQSAVGYRRGGGNCGVPPTELPDRWLHGNCTQILRETNRYLRPPRHGLCGHRWHDHRQEAQRKHFAIR